jgi:protein-disulfide isomerase
MANRRDARAARVRTTRVARRPQPQPGLSRETRRLLLIGIPIVLGLLAIVVVTNLRRQEESATAAQQATLIREDSPTLGAANAPVTIVEFLDPECEACRAAHPIVKRLLQEYDGQVKLVVRYFPLHKNSVLAAQATEAAGEQSKYWEMQELLFTNQQQWGEKQTPQTALFIEYARTLGLNVDQFTTTLNSGKYASKVDRDLQDARAAGATGTPTFFVNGRQVRQLDYAGLKAAIDDAR